MAAFVSWLCPCLTVTNMLRGPLFIATYCCLLSCPGTDHTDSGCAPRCPMPAHRYCIWPCHGYVIVFPRASCFCLPSSPVVCAFLFRSLVHAADRSRPRANRSPLPVCWWQPPPASQPAHFMAGGCASGAAHALPPPHSATAWSSFLAIYSHTAFASTTNSLPLRLLFPCLVALKPPLRCTGSKIQQRRPVLPLPTAHR
jgi:hypothetical protein